MDAIDQYPSCGWSSLPVVRAEILGLLRALLGHPPHGEFLALPRAVEKIQID